MVIRKAMKSDGAALDALLTKLIRDETRYDSNLSPEVVIKDNYAQRIEEEGSSAFVAEEDGNIVGYLYGFLYQIPGMMLRPVATKDDGSVHGCQYAFVGIGGNVSAVMFLFGIEVVGHHASCRTV